jgi:hypothetical protein
MAGFLMVAQRWDEARAICPDLREETSDDPECLGYRGVLGVKVDGTEEAARIFDLAGTVKGPYSFGVEKLRQAHCRRSRSQRASCAAPPRGSFGRNKLRGPSRGFLPRATKRLCPASGTVYT